MIAVDTNVVIAALLTWHEVHSRAVAALEEALEQGTLLLPQPVLIESFSVMTRLPSPHRLRPEVAYELLSKSFHDIRVAALPARKTWDLLKASVTDDIAGGRIYDAVIATAAIEAGAQVLLTFNPRDFEPFAERIAIRVP